MPKPIPITDEEFVLALYSHNWNRTHLAVQLRCSLRTIRDRVKVVKSAGYTVLDNPHSHRSGKGNGYAALAELQTARKAAKAISAILECENINIRDPDVRSFLEGDGNESA